MIDDLQPDEVVIAETIDRISRLPLNEAEKLIEAIRTKGAKLAIPGIIDLSELAEESVGISKIVLEAIQDMLLKLSLQMARDDYELRRERQEKGIKLAKQDPAKYKGRKPNIKTNQIIITLRKAGNSISHTAELAGCSQSQVKRIWANYIKSEIKDE